MKTLFGILLAMGLVFASLPAVAAQEDEAATLPGFGDAVTWTGEDGAPIASATVQGVENDFRGYEPGWDPEYGYAYSLVEISVVNESDKAIILKAYTFLLVDDLGGRHNRVSLNSAGVETFDDDLALAPGESADITLAYSIPAHANVAFFAWNPAQGQMHHVVLSTDVDENSAIAWGMENTSVFRDDFSNPVATFQVTGINDNWTDYAEHSAPEAGFRYMPVSVSITNKTDRPVVVEYYDFSLANANGTVSEAARVSVPEDVEEPFRDSVRLQAGESIEVTMVFAVQDNTEPVAVVWELDYSSINMVILAQAPGSPVDATPAAIATPS